jgi:hypothetical protein
MTLVKTTLVGRGVKGGGPASEAGGSLEARGPKPQIRAHLTRAVVRTSETVTSVDFHR